MPKRIIAEMSREGILNAFESGATIEELQDVYSQYTKKAIADLIADYQYKLAHFDEIIKGYA